MIRSVRIHEFGGPEVLRIEEIEVEEPSEGEVRIRIRAIGINRTDVTLRSGRSPGTAWAGLGAVGRLAAGQTVLVPAASSGVGLAALQIANRLGATPIALTRTSAKADELLARGAAAIVATEEQDVVGEVKRLTDGKGAGLVFDPGGSPTFAKLVEATASGGLLILYGALSRDQTTVPPFHIFARNLTIRGCHRPHFPLRRNCRSAPLHGGGQPGRKDCGHGLNCNGDQYAEDNTRTKLS
jgi:NADPH:quinone reductase-like Zn-dependent oxidoreductase